MISRSDLACASWQNIIATNWLQQLKPLAPRSALCSRTRRSNRCRYTKESIWLKRLACPTMLPTSVDGSFGFHKHQPFNRRRRSLPNHLFQNLILDTNGPEQGPEHGREGTFQAGSFSTIQGSFPIHAGLRQIPDRLLQRHRQLPFESLPAVRRRYLSTLFRSLID